MVAAKGKQNDTVLRLSLLYANVLVACNIIAKGLESIETNRNLILPGP